MPVPQNIVMGLNNAMLELLLKQKTITNHVDIDDITYLFLSKLA